MNLILIFIFFFPFSCSNVLATAIIPSQNNEKPMVKSIKFNEEIIFPENMRVIGENCFANNLIEVSQGKNIQVLTNKPFIFYIATQFGESYYNLQQYYGNYLDDLTFNSILLSTKQQNNDHQIIIPLTLKCKYNLHPFFRIKAFINIKFYQENIQEKYQFNLLLLCAKQNQIQAFTNFYIPGYTIFWMIFNLSIQVYHNYARSYDHLITFVVFLIGSLVIENDLLAYFVAGTLHILIVLKQRKNRMINNKMFILYMFFMVIVAFQIVLTFEGTKHHYLWNSFWIILDNFIILHISMFLVLRLVKLNRFRHVFWYFIIISIFSLLYNGKNRFFQLQFKNPLNLQCVKINVFFPIMMLPISNFLSTLTSWMNRVMAIAIIMVSALPLDWQVKGMAGILFGILLWEIYNKNMEVLRHRC